MDFEYDTVEVLNITYEIFCKKKKKSLNKQIASRSNCR